jgi:hypothetical protein
MARHDTADANRPTLTGGGRTPYLFPATMKEPALPAKPATILCVRRFGTLVLASFLFLAAGAPAFATGHGAGTLHFAVLRDGSPIGTHIVRFQEEGDTLTVEHEVRIAVSIAFITVYRYEQDRTEVLRDGRIVTFHNRTDDDGTVTEVTGRAVEGGIEVIGPAVRHTVPLDTVLTGYWNHQTPERRRLLDVGDGTVLEIDVVDAGVETVEAWGRAIQAWRYVLTGDLEKELWYDAAGIWVHMRQVARDGSIIEYLLLPEGGVAEPAPSSAPPAPSEIESR